MKHAFKNILERLLSETGQFGTLNNFLQTKTGLRLPPSIITEDPGCHPQ